jgi:hypothetical protein
LHGIAKQLAVKGRSTMSGRQLLEAIEKVSARQTAKRVAGGHQFSAIRITQGPAVTSQPQPAILYD